MSFYDSALIRVFFFILNNTFDIIIQFLFGTYLMYILNDLISFDIKFGHIER
jgi:hypothetical protein